MDMAITDYISVNFTCKYILFRNDNGFTIFQSKLHDMNPSIKGIKKSVIMKGVFDKIEAKDSFKAYAKWVDDPKYGMQLEIFSPVMIASSDEEGIKRFLTRYVKGIGSKTAAKIVKKYKLETIDKIKESPDNLSCIDGISKKKAQNIYEAVLQSDNIEKLSLFLFKFGVTSFNDVLNIYNALGATAMDMIMANPYCICDYTSMSNIHIADKIALRLGYESDNIYRISYLMEYYLSNHCFNSGDIYIKKDYFMKNCSLYINKSGLLYDCSDAVQEAALEYMVKNDKVVIDDKYNALYLKSLYTIESNTATYINQLNKPRISSLSDNIYNDFFEDYYKSSGLIPDPTQIKAVKCAYENRICVLTGGPGTGKTQTINAILSFIEHQDKKTNIVLCSPTGRAAKRMSELTGREACTIHRLLGLHCDNDTFNATYEIDADYIIVDECSMIDANLFYKLISAVCESKKTSLLLVGDKDQLPPVGCGFPFKDLVESGKIPLIKLEKLFRQAERSQINKNAKAVLNGITTIGDNGLSFDTSLQDFFFFKAYTSEQIRNLIILSIKKLLDLGTDMDDIVIISPTNKYMLGVEELNKLIQNLVNPDNNDVKYITDRYEFKIGDRVMQTVNDYNLAVFNGEIGKIVSINENDEELSVLYDDDKLITYDYNLAKELVLAYSMTVHKAQGAEYKIVIMPVSSSYYNLSRNIIYTAITRAKQRFVFIGEPNALANGILKNDNNERRTLLKERL